MEDFDRDSVQQSESEIKSINEAERVIDKVLSTGRNFYNSQNMFSSAQNGRPVRIPSGYSNLGSRRTQSQGSRRSFKIVKGELLSQ